MNIFRSNNPPKSVDAWGFCSVTHEKWLRFFEPIYHKYFRVDVSGLGNVPKSGGVLLIANHSGQLPIDGILIGQTLATKGESPRVVRAMMERFFPQVPFLGNYLNEVGGVVGDPINCENMLNRGEAIIVFPEGAGGAGKSWSERYKLQRFGLGFMHLAINTGTPIVPIGVVGCEETMPTLFHLRWLAKKLGAPYLPVTSPIPIPAKVRLVFGEPMVFEAKHNTENEVFEYVEQVKEEIASLMKQGLSKRRGWFL